MGRTKVLPNKVKSRDTGIKPFLESAKTAFPNMMRRVTQTARDWVVKEKHSEMIKPYLSDEPYPMMDDTYPTPFSAEFPPFPGGDWTDINAWGEEQWRFQCIISCRHTTKERDKCSAPIKCSYGAWTFKTDGHVIGWRFFGSDGRNITGALDIVWHPEAGRVGEIWATPKAGFLWGDILLDSNEKITAYFIDVGNPGGQYYHPILKRWFSLKPGRSTCDDDTNIKCVVCPVDPPMSFDDDSTSDTIAPGGSITMYVTGGLSTYSWSVSGTGYTLGSSVTTGLSNTLTSASGTCGVNYDAVASVTVTDTCGTEANFDIRNTGGQWTYIKACNRNRDTILEPNRNCYAAHVYDIIVGTEKWRLACNYSGEGICWALPWATCWGDGNPWNCNCTNPPPCGSPVECADDVGISCPGGCYPYGIVQVSYYYMWTC